MRQNNCITGGTAAYTKIMWITCTLLLGPRPYGLCIMHAVCIELSIPNPDAGHHHVTPKTPASSYVCGAYCRLPNCLINI